MIQQQHGKVTQTHVNAAADSVIPVDCYGFNSLLVWHEISGSPVTGGYVTVNNLHDQDVTGLLHPAAAGDSLYGLKVKAADVTASYMSIYRGVSRHIEVELHWTDGVHNVHVQPVNL